MLRGCVRVAFGGAPYLPVGVTHVHPVQQVIVRDEGGQQIGAGIPVVDGQRAGLGQGPQQSLGGDQQSLVFAGHGTRELRQAGLGATTRLVVVRVADEPQGAQGRQHDQRHQQDHAGSERTQPAHHALRFIRGV